MSGSKQIKVGAVLSYVAIAINILAGLVYTPWMIKQLGDSDYGLYTLANSLITLFLVDFGLSSATSRYISKYRAEGKREEAERFLGAIYKLYLIIDAVIFIVLLVIFFCIDSIYASLTPVELERFKVVYAISAIFSILNFPFVTFNGILTAYENFIYLKVLDIVYRVFNVGFTVIALLMGYGLYALVAVHAAVGLLMVLLKFIIIRKKVPLGVNFASAGRGLYKEIFSFSIWVTVSSLAQRLIFSIVPTVLGIVASTAAIAVFGVITTIEGYAYTVTSAINGMFLPRISKMFADGNADKKLDPLLNSVGKFQLFINGLIVAGFAVVGNYFIKLWMGPGYSDAYYGILLVLIPGIFYNSLQIANTTMIVVKKVNIQAYVNLATGVTNLILSFPLSKMFGVIGACVSIFIAYMLRAVLLLIIYHKQLPVNIPLFIKKCYVRMSIPVVLSVIAGIVMNMFIADSGWLVFGIKVIIIAVFYLGFVYLIGLDMAEKRKVLSVLKNTFKKLLHIA